MSPDNERRRGDLLVVSAIASFVISSLVSEVLAKIVGSGGLIGKIGIGVTALLVTWWLVIRVHDLRRRRTLRRPSVPADSELGAHAEQATKQLVALGSDVGGMAAAEWFEATEPRLHQLVVRHASDPTAVDEVAEICDALDAWYVRQRRPAELLAMTELLAAAGEQAGRRDLKEIAAARAATAHRLAGDLEAANQDLGRSAGLAARNRRAAAVRARRQVEWALSNLARADQCPPGADFDEHVTNARDRLEDAAAALPRADLTGDTSVHINLGVVALYRQDGKKALDHLGLAAARAQAARDVSTQAHALELSGVAAWSRDNPREAVAWWQEAEHLYAEIDEREGQARCLQHLGSAALISPVVATLLAQSPESPPEVASPGLAR
jgi:hypothetical protein